ncbi:hypothetical protein [Streptomyces sp. KL116D]|uniref:hypothetical protein n=1 Tax=Streptomyces sp. KL116D TaxID=3045152 RepID=UPI003556704A
MSDELSEKLKVKSGPTSFEETLLNAMLDLVDNTKPSDLENAVFGPLEGEPGDQRRGHRAARQHQARHRRLPG